MRRLLAVTAAVTVGVLGSFVFATPASAHSTEVSGKASCDTASGNWKVAWTIANDYGTDATLDVVTPSSPTSITADGGVAVEAGVVIPSHGSIVGVQNVDGSATSATLKVHAVWHSDGYQQSVPPAQVVFDAAGCSAAPTCVSAAKAAFGHTFGANPEGGYDATVTLSSDLSLCDSQPFTLVSYYAPSATFATPQYQFDVDTGTVDAAHTTVNLHVDIPPCYTQVDLIRGGADAIINPLTADSGTYHGKGILIASYNGGTGGCTQPAAMLKPNCDGSLEVDLSNVGKDSKYPTTFTVTDAAGQVLHDDYALVLVHPAATRVERDEWLRTLPD